MTFEKISELISKQLGIAKETITMDSEIIKDLGADSLDIVEMLMGLEDEFGIEVSEEEAIKLRTIADIVTLIDSKNK